MVARRLHLERERRPLADPLRPGQPGVQRRHPLPPRRQRIAGRRHPRDRRQPEQPQRRLAAGEVSFRDDRSGRLQLRKGSSADDDTAEYDLSMVAGPIMYAGVADIAGGIIFTARDFSTGVGRIGSFRYRSGVISIGPGGAEGLTFSEITSSQSRSTPSASRWRRRRPTRPRSCGRRTSRSAWTSGSRSAPRTATRPPHVIEEPGAVERIDYPRRLRSRSGPP